MTINASNKRMTLPGLSLVEVLVVVFIIGILLMIAVPALSSLVPGYQVQSSARGVANMAQQARLTAGNTQKPARLVLDCSGSNLPCQARLYVAVFNMDGDLDGWTELINHRRDLPRSVTIAPGNGTKAVYESPAKIYWAVFLPSSRVESSHDPMRLSFASKAGDYQVSVSNITGRVSVKKE